MKMERITRPHIASDDLETVEAVERSLRIVALLAAERAKAWPKQLQHVQAHKQRIGGLVAELNRIASNIEGMTPDELERLGRAELKRRGRSVPAATRHAPVASEPDPRSDALSAAMEELARQRQLLMDEQDRLKRQQNRVRAVKALVAKAEQKVASL